MRLCVNERLVGYQYNVDSEACAVHYGFLLGLVEGVRCSEEYIIAP
jgi:hypothetical protein